MSYPSDPFAKDQPEDQSALNPYAPPSGAGPMYGSPSGGAAPSGAPSPYGPAAGAPSGGQPSPYGQPDPYSQPSLYGGQPPGMPYGAPSVHNPYAPLPANDGMAIAAMILSIAGLFTCGITGIVGLILGIVSLGRISRTGARGKGMAIAGIAVGGLLIVWFLFSILFGFWDAFWSGFDEGYNSY